MEAGRGLDWSLGRLGLAAICALAGLAIVAPRGESDASATDAPARAGSESLSEEPGSSKPSHQGPAPEASH